MKKVKYFVLSLLVCFSFGCGPNSQKSKSDLDMLLKSINNIESYQCARLVVDSSFLCTLNITNELPKSIVCSNNGCMMQKCPTEYLCFQGKINDTDSVE